MLQPIHMPLAAGDSPAAILLHLGDTVSPAPTFTALAIRRFGQVEPVVILHLDDGGREALSAEKARAVADLLCDEPDADDVWARIARSLRDAAASAERQASAVRAGLGSGLGVRQARTFGGR